MLVCADCWETCSNCFGVLSFNGNKRITTSGGGALICENAEDKNTVMWYATQAREAYPYYQHSAIGYNYRMRMYVQVLDVVR